MNAWKKKETEALLPVQFWDIFFGSKIGDDKWQRKTKIFDKLS